MTAQNILNRRDILKSSAGLLGVNLIAATGCAAVNNFTMNDFAMTSFKNGEYTLPELPYDYDALEPLYNERTLRIHHDKHHAGYVNGLNSTLKKLEEARGSGDYSHIQTLCEHLAFNGSGHVLHCLFWNSMKPGGSSMSSRFKEQIGKSFGSVNKFSEQFKAAAKKVEASGWGVLAYEPMASQILILQAGKHQNLSMWGVVPLMVCDVWEHAYYLQYQNNRGNWVDNFMELANWAFAEYRLEKAKAAIEAVSSKG